MLSYVPCGKGSSIRSPSIGTSSYVLISNVQIVVISIERPNANVSAPAMMMAKATKAMERGQKTHLKATRHYIRFLHAKQELSRTSCGHILKFVV
jgi:hypothetical protein